MTATADGLVDDVIGAWARSVARREDTGRWDHAALARAALEVVEADAAALRRLDAPVTEIAARVGLDGAQRMVLMGALLPEAHPSAHLLVGLLSGDAGPARPTVAVAWETAGLGTVEGRAWDLLDPAGALVSSGLLVVEGDDVLLARRVRVPDRVVARLSGASGMPAILERVVTEPGPVDVDGFRQAAAALAEGEPLVWVRAPAGTAGAALAVAACRALGVTALVGDLGRVPGDASPATAELSATAGPSADGMGWTIAALVLEATLEGSVLVLLEAQHAVPHLDVVRRAAVPVIAVARSAWDPHWSDWLPTMVTASRLTRSERHALWSEAIGPAAVTEPVLAMRTTPEEIDLVGQRVRSDAAREGREPTPEDVRHVARVLGTGSRPGAGGGTTATLEDLVLPEHARREIERLIAWARDREDVLGLGELQGKGGKGSGICALFSGSPGTGKTLAAHVVADSLGADLLQVDLAAVVDKYIGETEKNLERVFARAETLNAVLFFDEADALFGRRSSVSDSRDRYANQEVSYLLQRMEAFEGITVLATNLRGNLDPAFARRLHFIVHFPDPDSATRRRLWEHHLAQLPGTDPDDPIDLDSLADALELAGGDIRNIVLAAAYDAVATGRAVGMHGLRVAVEREMAKLGRRTGAW